MENVTLNTTVSICSTSNSGSLALLLISAFTLMLAVLAFLDHLVLLYVLKTGGGGIPSEVIVLFINATLAWTFR